jgi:DNA-binding GntR family transcriptional regulator
MSDINLNLGDYKPLGDIVFDNLRNAIVKGILKPGERLMEEQIAVKLGVSRTPVREAIKKLEKEKLIEMVPRKGAYVARLTSKDVLDVLEIRKFLEGFSASLASQRITEEEIVELKKISQEFSKCIDNLDKDGMIEKDNEFHNLIFKATRNDKLIDIIKGLQDQFHRFRLVYFNEFDNYTQLKYWHEKICESISKRDENEASNNAKMHINTIEEIVLEWANRSVEND